MRGRILGACLVIGVALGTGCALRSDLVQREQELAAARRELEASGAALGRLQARETAFEAEHRWVVEEREDLLQGHAELAWEVEALQEELGQQGGSVRDLQERLSETQATAAGLRAALAQAREVEARLQREVATLSPALRQASSEREVLATQNRHLAEVLQRSQKALADLQQSLEGERAAQTTQVVALVEQARGLAQQNAQLGAFIGQLTARNDEIARGLSAAQGQLDELRETNRGLVLLLAEAQRKQGELAVRNEGLTTEVRRFRDAVEQARGEIERSQQRLAQAQGVQRETQAALEAARAQARDLEREVASAQAELRESQEEVRRLQGTQTALEAARAQARDLEGQVARLQQRVAELQGSQEEVKRLRGAQAALDGARAEISRLRQQLSVLQADLGRARDELRQLRQEGAPAPSAAPPALPTPGSP
ncbi:MAG: hypothetical protein HYY85_14105 [Deltaproteobacteria bacterium]|nr:hypothetical protein [Deltaproteobacteria bacterium]